jgi:hypothetical protein
MFLMLLGWVAIVLTAYTIYMTIMYQLYPVEPPPVKQPPVQPPPIEPQPVDPQPPRPTLPPSNSPRFLFFSASWCPWSKKAKQQWNAFVTEFDRFPSTYGGKTLTLELIDGDQQREMVNAYGINAYPTFKLVTSDGVTEMSGYPSPDAFKTFLIKSLGPEEPAKIE